MVVYGELLREFSTSRVQSWDYLDLLSKFGRHAVDALVEQEILVRLSSKDRLILAFEVPGTAASLIRQRLQTQVLDFDEIKSCVPGREKAKTQRVRRLIKFLEDFSVIETIELMGRRYATACGD